MTVSGSQYAVLDHLGTTRVVHIAEVGRRLAFGAPLYGHIQGEVVETVPPCGETEWSETPGIDMPGHQRTHKGGIVEIKMLQPDWGMARLESRRRS